MMRRGFTIIELLIAIALASFIMLGMTQGYRNAIRLQHNAQDLLVINRRVALLFNQMERDITTSVAYRKKTPYKAAEGDKKGAGKENNKKKESGKQQSKPEQKSGRDAKKKEPPTPSMCMEVYDDAAYKHRGKKWQTTKSISFLSTTPLELFGHQQERLVRVGYELIPNKKQSTLGKQSYNLVRRQTSELKNTSFKNNDDAKAPTVNTHVVAEHINKFSLAATYLPKPPTDKDGKKVESKEKIEPVKTFVWGEKEDKKTSTALPEFIALHIELWNEAYDKTYSFECMIPCFVRDEIESENDKKNDAEQKSKEEKKGDKKPEESKQSQSSNQVKDDHGKA